MNTKNKKTKVAFVSIFAYPLFNKKCELTFGGAEVQISLISRELARDDDFDVNIIVADTGQGKIEVYDDVTLRKAYKRGRSMINLLKAPFILYRTLKELNPDVVICRAAGVEVGIAGVYARINRKKFIYSIASNKDLDGSRHSGIRGKVFKFGFNLANKYIAQSEDQKKTLEEKTKKEILLIKNSFTTYSHLKQNLELRKIEKKYILWVGRSIGLKRPELFLKLAKDNSQFNFLMILQKTDIGRWEKLKRKAEAINNLKFVESVPFVEMNEVYKNASVFVNTSTGEGFPNTFIQSSMLGIPMLSLKVNPDNFLDKYRCGVACDDDYSKMKNSLNKIMEDKEYFEGLGKNAKKYFNENHNIKNNIIGWKKIIKK